jgi:hypothetical protein
MTLSEIVQTDTCKKTTSFILLCGWMMSLLGLILLVTGMIPPFLPGIIMCSIAVASGAIFAIIACMRHMIENIRREVNANRPSGDLEDVTPTYP